MIYMDVNRCVDDLKEHLFEALELSANLLLEAMKIEIPKGNLPGKPEWRDNLRDDLRILNREFSNTGASMAVGHPYEEPSPDFIKAMLINYGGGSRSDFHGPPIQTWPGKISWDDNLDNLIVSPNVRTHYFLPKGFNQKGSHYFENAVRIIRNQYFKIMQEALNSFDMSKYVHSNARKGGR